MQVKTNTQLHAAHDVVLKAFAALASPAPAESGEPVAWRVKDFADGWIYHTDEARALRLAEHMSGALVHPVYLHPPAESAGSPSTSGVGVTIKPLQNGLVQFYALAMALFVAAFVGYLVLFAK